MILSLFRKAIRAFYRLTTMGLAKGPHITRFSMYTHLSGFAAPRQAGERVLSVSHSEELAQLLGFSESQITDASYPEYNVLHLPFEDGCFDAVVSDQVLEHVEGSPQAAVDEMFRVLKPGGLAVHTTCFINPVHGNPGDFWRFTPDALKLLVKEHGEVVDAGGWGNRFIWPFVFAGLRFEPIPRNRLHPANWLATRNDPYWPVVTWVVCKKKRG